MRRSWRNAWARRQSISILSIGGTATGSDEDAAKRMVADAAAESKWIIEGVYGWLAELALPRATSLIWLDLP
ncbi:hypothetical protein [Bradyrhizobium sp.]|uniref:hypothetical protein n=1 Tax=Bradyrhizobium sp. TaxID=376 RepID=UPI003BB21E53